MHFFYLPENEFISFYQQIARALITLYLEYLQFCGLLCRSRHCMYHQHKDKNHFWISIEGSLIYIKNKSGPKIKSWGTSQFKLPASEKTSFKETKKVLFNEFNSNYLITDLLKPKYVIFSKKKKKLKKIVV